MNLVWSLPVRGERLDSTRGDLVRARALIEALRAEGHRVTVVADDEARGARARVGAYRRAVRPLLPRRVATTLRDLARVAHARAHGRRVAEAGRREGADLIVETQVHFAGSGAFAAGVTGLPLVLDDCSPWTEERALGAGLPGLARRVFRTQAGAASALVASSAQIRGRLLEEGAPPGRVHVVPNGVDVAPFAAVDRAAARRRMGFGGETVVVFVGSFQPWHRAELLLEAFRLEANADLHLVLIGDGPGRRAILSRAAALGLAHRVAAPGPLRGMQLAETLSACDIGALPASNDYGQPMKLLDYAAAGLAIVAADVPPVRDMIDPGVTGLLVPPEDPEALAAAFATLARVPVARTRLGRAAHERVAAPADWQVRARALLETVAPVRAPLVREPAHRPPTGSRATIDERSGARSPTPTRRTIP